MALSEETGLGVDLAASVGNGRVEIVDTNSRYDAHGVFPDCIGYRPSPFRAALGCAFLSALGPKELVEYSDSLTANTKGKDRAAASELPTKLKEIRARGCASREPGNWGRAVDYGGIHSAIGVAIRTEDQVVGALSLVWLAERCSVDEIAGAHLERLNQTADTIGRHFASSVGSIE